MKLKEKQLRDIIKESLKKVMSEGKFNFQDYDEDNEPSRFEKIGKKKRFDDEKLNEGTTSQISIQRWEEAEEILGAEEMLDFIFKALDCDTIDKILKWINQDYELWENDIVYESKKKVIKEEIGSLEDVILCSTNNWPDINETLVWIKNALLKKVKRGITPDRDHLIDCSVLRRCQQLVIKRYEQQCDVKLNFTPAEKRKIRENFADEILEWLNYDMQKLNNK